MRVSKNQIIWGGNYLIVEIGINKSCWIFWDKNNGDSLFADGELAWTSFNSPLRKIKIHWTGRAAINETGINKIHPTQKPVALYKWIIRNYSNPGDLILDTHGGSFSHAIAAHEENANLDIMDNDEDYFNAGKNWYKNNLKQLKLFTVG